ncbi:MAG: monovalent cation:proton antiporter-2 (CPA2) family protein [Pseudomarimonas sp.]
MHNHGVLELVLVFLIAAVIAVPLFQRLGLGAVLGFLVAGVVIGPNMLGLVPDPESVLAASEFGVVMMLFVIGLELSPARLWVMRRQVFGIGALQVVVSTLALGGVLAMWVVGGAAAVIIGMGLALSSTAVGLQLLAERKELTAAHGRLAFAILLFQDIIAIPLLAAIPLLGSNADSGTALGWTAVSKAVLTIAAVVIGGRVVLRHVFRAVARARTAEVFTATALLVVVGTAWLMAWAGLSMGLGAFLAGVLLADSEFRHELESHIDPFKSLLLGLFFIAVGMSIDLNLVTRDPLPIALAVLGLLGIKALILIALGRAAGLNGRSSLSLAAVLGMGGEFAFVVFAESFKFGLIEAALRDQLVVVVGLSMAATPLLLLAFDRGVPATAQAPAREADTIGDEYSRVIIAGFGRMGQIVGRLLRAQHISFTALENSAEQVDLSRRFGSKIYFGDPARPELLRAAHADRAEVFVLTTDDPEANIRTARVVKRLFPHLKVFARARNRQHAFKLMDFNVDGVVRETFGSSLEMAEQVMQALGIPADQAAQRAQQFRLSDEALLREQHLFYDDEAALVSTSQDALRDLQAIFEADDRARQTANSPEKS